MLVRLSRGPVSVSQLAEPLAVSLAAVVQHLPVLEASGVIRTEKVGRVRTCSIAPEGLRFAEQWINERMTLWERRLDRLGELLVEHEAEQPPQKKKKKRERAGKSTSSTPTSTWEAARPAASTASSSTS